MSLAYDLYLKKHVDAVRHNISYFMANISSSVLDEIFPGLNWYNTVINASLHDQSKYTPEEYEAYDQYFYQNGKNSAEGKLKFDFALLHHVRNNPHHWQYWVLIDDDGFDDIDGHQVKALDMPDIYIVEMIADWWSFSYNNYLEALSDDDVDRVEAYKHLYEVFDWYNDHKDKDSIIFSTNTRNKVERFLDALKYTLDANQPFDGLE